MNVKKTLAILTLGLALLVGISGTSNLAPTAHAASGVQFCRYVGCFVAPTLTVSGGYGELRIQGANWAANRGIEIDVYAPVSSKLPSETTLFAFTDKNGAFLSVYIVPGSCFYGQMEVQAIDSVSNTVVTSYGVPGCIG